MPAELAAIYCVISHYPNHLAQCSALYWLHFKLRPPGRATFVLRHTQREERGSFALGLHISASLGKRFHSPSWKLARTASIGRYQTPPPPPAVTARWNVVTWCWSARRFQAPATAGPSLCLAFLSACMFLTPASRKTMTQKDELNLNEFSWNILSDVKLHFCAIKIR